MPVTLTVWSTTHLFHVGERATIPQFDQDIQGFHMNSKTAMVISDFLESKT